MSLVPDQVPLLVISACAAVHRHIGPGLPAAIYRDCLDRELRMRELIFERDLTPVFDYCGAAISCAELKLDFLIEEIVLLQIKAVDTLLPQHTEELKTLLRIVPNVRAALAVNFHAMDLHAGIRRVYATPHPSSHTAPSALD